MRALLLASLALNGFMLGRVVTNEWLLWRARQRVAVRAAFRSGQAVGEANGRKVVTSSWRWGR